MAYPDLDGTLTSLAPVKDLPGYGEPASLLHDVIRQTRTWTCLFFDKYFGTGLNILQPAAFQDGTRSTAFVRGTNLVDLSEREIKQGTLQEQDFLIGSIQDANVQEKAITNEKISTFQGSAHVKDGTISADKLEPKAYSLPVGEQIGPNHLLSRAVTGPKLNSDPYGLLGAVSKEKIQPRAVDGRKLPSGTLDQWLIGGQAIRQGPLQTVRTNCLAPVTLKAPFSIDLEGTVKMETITTAMGFVYQGLTYTAYGLNSGVTNLVADSKAAWFHYPFDGQSQVVDGFPMEPYVFAVPTAVGIEFTKEGGYIMFVRASGYKTNSFRMKVSLRLDGTLAPGTSKAFYSGDGYSESTGTAFATTPTNMAIGFQVSNILPGSASTPVIEFSTYTGVAGALGEYATDGRNVAPHSVFVLLLKVY